MKKILPIIAAIIVAGGLGFYIGTKSAGSTGSLKNNGVPSDFQGFQQVGNGSLGGNRRSGLGQNGGFASGEIIKKDDMSITLKLADGGSNIIIISSSTAVMKSTQGSLDDAAIGGQVTVMGSVNSDGSITAQSIQLRPNLRSN